MASLIKNIIFSTILTVSNYLFPLITFPYVTRVLGVNNIGICNFVDSIIHYFIIFSMMGIVTTGIREVAKSKTNKSELSRAFSSLFSLNLISSIIAILILLITVFLIPQLQEHKFMFYVGASKILANTLLIEWLYKGLEDFKFITARTIIIRSFYVLAVILFVKHPDDYTLYFGLTTFSVILNAVVNLYYSRHFVTFSFKMVSIKPYLKSFFVLGVYLVLTSFYITFNVAYLGFATNTTEVGFYTTATKFYSIIMGFYTAFTGVMLPRMTSILAEGKRMELIRMIKLSIEILLAFSIPIIIISEVCTSEIIQLIAGPGYEGAILPMKIVMPLMLVIGYEQIMVLQILVPMHQDSAILHNSIIGAVVAIIFNILIVSRFASVGTSFVWIISEVSVLLSAQFYVTKLLGMYFPFILFIKRLILAIPIIVVGIFIDFFLDSGFISLILVGIFVFVTWLLFEVLLFKNVLIIRYLKSFSTKFSMMLKFNCRQ